MSFTLHVLADVEIKNTQRADFCKLSDAIRNKKFLHAHFYKTDAAISLRFNYQLELSCHQLSGGCDGVIQSLSLWKKE